jgi:cell wall-associated NlpC family hydrolase
LKPADLIFYGKNQSDASTVYVAMYVGSGKMAEAYDAGTPVRITPVRDESYWGAKRFLAQ